MSDASITKNYNGEALKAEEKKIAFGYTDLDVENRTNPECIKTIPKAGRMFKGPINRSLKAARKMERVLLP